MQVAEYSVVDEDGKVTGRHHHHAILQGNLTWQEIKDLWRDSTGRPMGLVKVEPIDLTCSSFERLTTYMTKARARIRRWRQSQGLKSRKLRARTTQDGAASALTKRLPYRMIVRTGRKNTLAILCVSVSSISPATTPSI